MQRDGGNYWGSHHGLVQLRLRFGVRFIGFCPTFLVAASAAMLRHHHLPETSNRARSRPVFLIPMAKPTPVKVDSAEIRDCSIQELR